jgi:RimJ/RimL family protein N-acetyltransferase
MRPGCPRHSARPTVAELRFPEPALSDGVVVLRPWQPADMGFVVRACQDPEVSRYSPVIPFPYVEADAAGWFGSQEPTRLAGDALDFAVADASTGKPLGAIGLHKLDRRLLTAETGYWLAREARGHGHMTRAVRLLATWVFEELNLARLELRTDPENLPSQRIAERCGFHMEGHLRSNMLVLHSGERRDSFVFGLLSGELAR